MHGALNVKIIANIYAHNRSITRKRHLPYRVRMVRQSPVRATPYISLCFICTGSRQAIIVSPLKWSMLRVFHRHDYISRPCAHSIYNRTFHLGSTIVAATKNRPSAVKPYFCHKHLLFTPIFIFSVFIFLIFSRIMEISVQQYRLYL